MEKIISIRHEKIWGYELWLHSPLKEHMTKTQNGEGTIGGPLVKIIKANQPLSVQVHPDDFLAKKFENEINGKSESWYILEATAESEFIVGIKTVEEQKIKQALNEKTFFDILNTHKPKPGEFINVPAGLVHGIGKDSKVLEVQQPSDTTYRFYDYDRLENGKPRKLHIEKSIKCAKQLKWKLESIKQEYQKYKTNEYSISIFSKKTNKFKLDKRSIIVDLENEEAYYIKPGEENKISFNHFALIEYK